MNNSVILARVRNLVLTCSILVASCVVFAGCGNAPAGTTPVGKPAATTPSEGPALAKIVFVDQVECCNCTKNRIDATWKALTEAVGEPPVIPVERIHSDTQPDLAAEYTTFKPIMVMPAVYFVGADGSVLEMLQGELRTVQIIETLTKLSGRQK